MVEKTKTIQEIEADADSERSPRKPDITLNITKPKPLSEQEKPIITESSSEFTNVPDTGDSPLNIEDDMGVMGKEMVFEDDIGAFDFVGDTETQEIMRDDGPVTIKKTEPESDYAKALKYGFAQSATGLALYEDIPKPIEQQFGEEVVSTLGQIGGDLPVFISGFFLGGGPVSLVTGLGGGFGLAEGVKQVLRDSIEKGDIETSSQWWERLKRATEETAKGYATGAVTGGAGATAKTATELAEASLLAKKALPFLAEVTAVTQTGAVVNGYVPTAKDYALAATALTAIKGVAKGTGEIAETVKKLKQVYAETGKHPSKVTLEELAAPIANERGGGEFFDQEPLKGASQESTDAQKVNDMYRRAEEKKKVTLGDHAAKAKRSFNRMFIDRTSNMKDELNEAFGKEEAAPMIRKYVLSSGWHGNAKLLLDRYRKDISKGLTKAEHLELDKVIASRRTIEIDLNKSAERERLHDSINLAKQERDKIKGRIDKALSVKRKPLDAKIEQLTKVKERIEAIREKEGKLKREQISELSQAKKGIEQAEKDIRKLGRAAAKEVKERVEPLKKAIEDLADKINRLGKMAHPEGLTMKEHQAYLDSLSPEMKQRLFPRADAYSQAMRDQLNELLKEGLLTQKAYNAIAKKGEYYSLREYLETIDPEEKVALRGQSKKVMGSGLHRLDEGSLELMENDHTVLLEEVISRTQRRIFNNRAAQRLHVLAEKTVDPNQGILSDILRVAEEGEEIPAGYMELYAMVEGERKTMWMREDIAKEYMDEPLITRQSVVRWLEMLTLARPLKISATGWNPEFFITNLPRDMMLMWGATNQYSSTFPIAMVQMAKDMLKVAPDLATKKGRYEAAAKQGMLQDLLTAQGRPVFGKGKWKTFSEALAWPGEFTETLTRMAVRERAIKNGLSEEEAAFEARNVLDYTQAGHAAQIAEMGSPYIKAAIAGTRAVLRYAKENPGMFAYKMAQLGSFSASLYYYNTVMSGMPEAYDSIPTTDKAKFFNILIPSMAQTDENKNVRVPYIRIAKDQGQQMFTPLFDAMMALKLGRDFDYEQLTDAFHGGLPVTEQSVFGPAASMISSLHNYSLFFRDNIYKGKPVELWAEYDSRTNPMAYKLGQMTSYVDEKTGERKSLPGVGVSPKRLEVAVGSVIAQSHPFAPMVGESFRAIMDKTPTAKKREIYDEWNSIPGLRRLIKWTKPYNPQALKSIEKAKIAENTAKKIHNDKLKEIFEKEKGGLSSRAKAVLTYTKTVLKDKKGFGGLKEWRRLNRRFEMMQKMEMVGDIPNKPFWYELKEISDPETKALAYHNTWKKQTPEMQDRYDSIYLRLGIVSKKELPFFMSKLLKLKKENKK